MIGFANYTDIDEIMAFIDQYWRKGHILGNNKDFFEYEHLLSEGVTYVISRDENNIINAILGYIPYGKTNRDIMTVMWKANHTAHSSLGLELFKYLKDNGDVRIMASPGSNPQLKGLYRYLGYQFGKMNQWYRLRRQKTYNIANVIDAEIPEGDKSNKYRQLNNWGAVEEYFDFKNYTKVSKPYKESWYIKKRYYNHPIYNYDIYGIKSIGEKYPLMMVFRVVAIDGINIIRLVDCIGDYTLLSGTTGLIDDILERYEAEYVDCYEVGLSDTYMYQSGWKKRADTKNIIPNYFSPFVKDNIDIYYFSNDPDIVLFKGDGDQDRPN